MLIRVTGYTTVPNTGNLGTKSLLLTPTPADSKQFGVTRSYATDHTPVEAQCFQTSGTPHSTGYRNIKFLFSLSCHRMSSSFSATADTMRPLSHCDNRTITTLLRTERRHPQPSLGTTYPQDTDSSMNNQLPAVWKHLTNLSFTTPQQPLTSQHLTTNTDYNSINASTIST
jgi:hypothetical protein